MWSRKLADETNTDTIFIDSLSLAANLGPSSDCWGRTRTQPVLVSVLVHLARSYLNAAAEHDDVRESIDYSTLYKAVVALVDAPGASFAGPVGLARAVTLVALEQADETALEVEVHVEVPKLVLMASTFKVEMRTGTNNYGMKPFSHTEVSIEGLVFHVTIGVNPAERLTKQQVLTRIRCLEQDDNASNVDYMAIVKKVCEVSRHLASFVLCVNEDVLFHRLLRRPLRMDLSHWRSSPWT